MRGTVYFKTQRSKWFEMAILNSSLSAEFVKYVMSINDEKLFSVMGDVGGSSVSK